ncbi:hypothetical protein [Kitasatospora mediocidica]|uniref:hypothetical protein n=1 Tax=Kitasatospora mediocidica TaxID=58352 RepID=UPI00056B4276|nr:hypothetical protein [Kitasatospora mediocidica]
MFIVYGFVFIWGIGFPAEHANSERISAWWHGVLAALLIGAAAAFLAFVIPNVVSAFASGSMVGCLIGIVGAPFWGHSNQEAGLAVGLTAALLVLALTRRAVEVRRHSAPSIVIPTPAAVTAAGRDTTRRPTRHLGVPARSDGLVASGAVEPLLTTGPSGDATITLERGSGLRAMTSTAVFNVELRHVVKVDAVPGEFKDGRQLHRLTLSPVFPFMLGIWLLPDEAVVWRGALSS